MTIQEIFEQCGQVLAMIFDTIKKLFESPIPIIENTYYKAMAALLNITPEQLQEIIKLKEKTEYSIRIIRNFYALNALILALIILIFILFIKSKKKPKKRKRR